MSLSSEELDNFLDDVLESDIKVAMEAATYQCQQPIEPTGPGKTVDLNPDVFL